MAVTIEHFTDPTCPIAFSAEAQRRRIDWLYGDGLVWHNRMVVLSDSTEAMEEHGFTPEKIAGFYETPAKKWGMPLNLEPKERLMTSEPACLLYVGAARHADKAAADGVLRGLRTHGIGGSELIDEESVLREVATEAGLDPDDAIAWAAEPETLEQLEKDKADARDPEPAGWALKHRLGGGGDRYGTPSYELSADGETITAPGYQPAAALEMVIANLDPEISRREDPESVTDVLQWASEPLATAEVAAVLDTDIEDARSQLEESDATFKSQGEDGYWSL